MTVTNQNFRIYRGDTHTIHVDLTQADGSPYDSTLVMKCKRCAQATAFEVLTFAVWVAVDDPGEDVSEVGERVDIVQLTGLDQGRDDGPVLGTAVRRDLIMPGVWGKKLKLHIHSTAVPAACDRSRRSTPQRQPASDSSLRRRPFLPGSGLDGRSEGSVGQDR